MCMIHLRPVLSCVQNFIDYDLNNIILSIAIFGNSSKANDAIYFVVQIDFGVMVCALICTKALPETTLSYRQCKILMNDSKGPDSI